MYRQDFSCTFDNNYRSLEKLTCRTEDPFLVRAAVILFIVERFCFHILRKFHIACHVNTARISEENPTGVHNAKQACINKNKKIEKKRQRKRRERPRAAASCLVRDSVGRMNSGETQRHGRRCERRARETKEILKDCHGNGCFGNRVLKRTERTLRERGRAERVGSCEGRKREARVGVTPRERKMD